MGRGGRGPGWPDSTPLLQGAPPAAGPGPGTRWHLGTSTDVHPCSTRGAMGQGQLPYILFLILPFLVWVPRPKAPLCSSWARRRLRADSCFRPPRCRKRNFSARRRCFRICCLVLSSERTRPAGAPGLWGWDAPVGNSGSSAFRSTPRASSSRKLPDLLPYSHPFWVHWCGPRVWLTVGAQ